jgi:hypothetical protein
MVTKYSLLEIRGEPVFVIVLTALMRIGEPPIANVESPKVFILPQNSAPLVELN